MVLGEAAQGVRVRQVDIVPRRQGSHRQAPGILVRRSISSLDYWHPARIARGCMRDYPATMDNRFGHRRGVWTGLAGLLLVAAVLGAVFGPGLWRDWQRRQAYEGGLAALEAKDYARALALVQPYAQSGDPDIGHVIGRVRLFGPPELQDTTQGLALEKVAADGGNMRASYFLGLWLLEEAPEALKDDAQAMARLKAAADCGMPAAADVYGSQIGIRNQTLDGWKEALRYMDIAATAGVKGTASKMGALIAHIEKSKGRPIDDPRSFELLVWLSVGAEEGEKAATRILESIITKAKSEDLNLLHNVKEEARRRIGMFDQTAVLSCGLVRRKS